MPNPTERQRQLATKLYTSGNSKYNQNKLEDAYKLYLKAIKNLSAIGEENYTPNDWLNVGLYQNMAISTCQDATLAQFWYEIAEYSLSRGQMPIQDLSPDDWRHLAIHHQKLGDLFQDKEDKVFWYKKSLEDANNIIPSFLDHNYWRTQAKCQNDVGVYSVDTLEKISWYTKAIKSLENIYSIEENIFYIDKKIMAQDFRCLALYYKNKGLACESEKEKIACFENALEHLSCVIKMDGTIDDIFCVAINQKNIANTYSDPSEKFLWNEKMIIGLLSLPQNIFKNSYQRRLVSALNYLGVKYRNIPSIEKATNYFYAALDYHKNNIPNKEAIDYKQIAFSYNELATLSIPCSAEHQLYIFASDVFLGKELTNIRESFLQIHYQVVNFNHLDLGVSVVHQQLLNFMQLLEMCVVQDNFPSLSAKEWLSDINHRQQFKALENVTPSYDIKTLPPMLAFSHNPYPLFNSSLQSNNIKQEEQKEIPNITYGRG